MKPTGFARTLWGALAGTRLAVACLAAALALMALGQAARLVTDPEVAYRLRVWGLADVPRSGWFVFVFGALAVNLVCGICARIPQALRDAGRSISPPPDDALLLRSEVETVLGQDALLKAATRLGRWRVGRVSVVRREQGELQLAAQRGRFSGLGSTLAHLFVGVALGGAAWMSAFGFEARALVDEGGKTRAVELVRGAPPEGWREIRSEGRTLPGYYFAGFEIERSAASPGGEDLLRFHDGSGLAGEAVLAPGRPVRFRGLTLHWLGEVPASARSVDLTVTDRASSVERRFAALSRGQSISLEDFGFRVLEIQPPTDLNGPAVQIEYQEGGRAPEDFWIFADYPDYDFAHRKVSREHFTLEEVRQRSASEILIDREPGALALWGGLLLAAALFVGASLRPSEKFWFRWTEGKVEIRGWGAKRRMFEPTFHRVAGLLGRDLEKGAGDGRA